MQHISLTYVWHCSMVADESSSSSSSSPPSPSPERKKKHKEKKKSNKSGGSEKVHKKSSKRRTAESPSAETRKKTTASASPSHKNDKERQHTESTTSSHAEKMQRRQRTSSEAVEESQQMEHRHRRSPSPGQQTKHGKHRGLRDEPAEKSRQERRRQRQRCHGDSDRTREVVQRTRLKHVGTHIHDRLAMDRQKPNKAGILVHRVWDTNARSQRRTAHHQPRRRNDTTRRVLGVRLWRGERVPLHIVAVPQSTNTTKRHLQSRLHRDPGNLTRDTVEMNWTMLTRRDDVWTVYRAGQHRIRLC